MRYCCVSVGRVGRGGFVPPSADVDGGSWALGSSPRVTIGEMAGWFVCCAFTHTEWALGSSPREKVGMFTFLARLAMTKGADKP